MVYPSYERRRGFCMITPFKQRIINRATRQMSVVLARSFPDFFCNQVRNPIFLIGCFRSGTTLLARLLGMHRDIANWSEANEILDPQWYPWQPANSNLTPLEYDPVAVTTRWWNDNQLRQKEIQANFGAYQWLQRKPNFLNKSPYNTFRIPYLLEMFPKARFIHISRDGRAVAYSHAIKIIKENHLQEWPEPQRTLFTESFDELIVWLATFWKICLEEITQQDKALGLTESGIMLDLNYEDLCSNPFETLDHICHFIDLNSARFMPNIKRVQIEAQNYKWKEKLDTDLVSRMTATMEPILSWKSYL